MRTSIIALLIVSLSGCAATVGDGVEREGALRLFDYFEVELDSVPPIRGVSVKHGIRVEVTITTSPASARLTADQNLFDLIVGHIDEDGFLDIRSTEGIDPMVAPVVRINSSALDYVSAREEGTSASVIDVTRERLGIAASEGANVDVTGTCTQLTIVASGGGTLDASELRCVRGDLDVQGGTTVRAQLSTAVTVAASGESQITITGSPSEVSERLTDGSTLTIE